jgi:hypothetical protein
MAYVHFDKGNPDATTQTLAQMGQSMRDNLKAIRDMVAAGTLIGWNGTPSGGTADQPAVITHSKGTERIRETITWGSTGGATGNPQVILYEYSSNSGTSYDTIGTLTYTFDASGNVTAWAWS